MRSKSVFPLSVLISCLMMPGCGLERLGNMEFHYTEEEEPAPGDVVVPVDPDDIPEQGPTKPEGSGGVVPGTPGENVTGGGNTGGGSVNAEELALEFVSPASGSVDGGYEVRVRGSMLDENGIVRFGALQSPSQIYVNSKVVRAVVPPGKPGCVDVTWTQDEETLTIHNGFCYVEKVGVDSVLPKIAVQNQVTPVVIYGHGFDENTRVYFNSADQSLPLIEPIVDSSSEMHGYLPDLAIGKADMVIVNAASHAVMDDIVEVLPEMVVTDIQPMAIAVGQNPQIQVKGTGFGDPIKVSIAGQILEPRSHSETSLTVQAPILDAGDYDLVVYDTIRQYRWNRALHYYQDDGSTQLFAVEPDYGSVKGGDAVQLIGANMPDSGNVLFGARTADITSRLVSSWSMKTPVSAAGVVDVKLGKTTLKKAFEFMDIPEIQSLSPGHGMVKDGFKTTLTGSGFTADTRIFFGTQESPQVRFVNANQMEVTVPVGAGTVPLRVIQGKADVTSAQSFTYDETAEIVGLSPAESVVTGQTPIKVYGAGFKPGMKLKVDGVEVDVAWESGNVMSFVAPAHDEGKAGISLICADGQVCAESELDYYVASNSITGGYGGEIDGELHVTVLTVNTGDPIPGATVYIGSDPDHALTGTTDDLGRVSFFGADIKDDQIVIACAPEHSCNTMQPVNSRYVTLLLEDWHLDENNGSEQPPVPDPPPDQDIDWTINPIANVTIPYEPKQPYLMGHVRGMGKVDLETYPDYQNVAFVKQSALSTYDYSYDAEDVYLVRNENGPYRLKARKGEVAIAAICGLYNEARSDFIPKYMGIVRHQMVSDGKILQNDIECNIPLNQTQKIKLIDPPLHSGPDIVMTHGFIFLGNEGYIGGTISGWMEGFMNGHSRTELVVASKLPQAINGLEDMSFAYVVGAYTLIYPDSDSLAYTSPATVFYSYNNPPHQDLIEVGPAAPIPVFVTSENEDVLKTGRVAWTVEYPQNVDFYAMTIRLYSSGKSNLLYQFYLPGTATTAEFVPYHAWPENDPNAVIYVQLTAYKSIRSGFDFNLFSTAELRYNYIHSSTTSTLVVRNPNVGEMIP